jgi:hypothetical protein
VTLRRVALAFAFCVLCAATVLTQDRALLRRAAFPAEQDQLYLPRPGALRAMSLGHHELAADLVFVRAIIYFGTQLARERDYRWLQNYLDTIVQLDPKWRTPYRWAGVATIYDGREITNESVLRSSHFLELGAKQFPDDWELTFMLACNYLFELKSDDPAEKAKWRRIGGEYLRHAALVGGAPAWVPLLAATVLRQQGDEAAAIKHLEEVYWSTTDEKTREEVRNRLVALHAKFDVAEAARQHAAFQDGWRKTVPYASPDFYAVLGPAPSPRLDPEFVARQELLELPTIEP